MNEQHRNIRKKHFCPRCDHYHHQPQSGVADTTGLCLLYPPTPVVLGIAQVAPSVLASDTVARQNVPILQRYYPAVGPGDSCSQWTPQAQGEA
jgi:hypothetical protein